MKERCNSFVRHVDLISETVGHVNDAAAERVKTAQYLLKALGVRRHLDQYSQLVLHQLQQITYNNENVLSDNYRISKTNVDETHSCRFSPPPTDLS